MPRLSTFADVVSPALGAFQAGQQVREDHRKQQTLAEIGSRLQAGEKPGDVASLALQSGDLRGFTTLSQLGMQQQKLNRVDQPKPPTGFTFNDPNNPASGVTPLPGFIDAKIKLKRAGAPQTTVNIAGQKGETEFQKTLGKQSAKLFGKLAEQGLEAQNELAQINQLPEILKRTGGGFQTAVKGVAANFGINVEGATDLQLATQIIDKLTPAQRVPGSGATSDFEARLFKSALPSLWRTPQANLIITGTMQALAEAKAERGRVANRVFSGELTRKQAQAALRAIPDPWARFKQWRIENGINSAKDVAKLGGASSQGGQPQRIRIDVNGNRVQ